MKKIYYLLLITFFVASCNIFQKPGNIEISVSYFYNNFQGYKPDVGAVAYLINEKASDSLAIDSLHLANVMAKAFLKTNGKYLNDSNILTMEADVTGKINYKDIPSGKYLLIIGSNGRSVFSKKNIQIAPGKTLSLVKNFGYVYDRSNDGEFWN